MKRSKPFELLLHPRVMLDFENAFNYYSGISYVVSQNFLSKFYQALEKLSISPYNYSKLTKRLRRIKLGKFPYMFVYSINGNYEIVNGLYHQKAKPSHWRKK